MNNKAEGDSIDALKFSVAPSTTWGKEGLVRPGRIVHQPKEGRERSWILTTGKDLGSGSWCPLMLSRP